MQHEYAIRWMMDLTPTGRAETVELAAPGAGTSSAIRAATWTLEPPQQICAVLFADAVGFSKLSERQIPKFTSQYLGCAMQALQSLGIVPLAKNTWGDGLYLAFESVRDAGLFALEFRDNILNTPWLQLGFKSPMSVRIGVDAGPVFRIYDPMFGQWTYTGAHVTRAARLEPSTDPGRVFATLSFAALAAADGVVELECQPVGSRTLVKGAGELPVFELIRKKIMPETSHST
jgi:class 3 adenylate cyclase